MEKNGKEERDLLFIHSFILIFSRALRGGGASSKGGEGSERGGRSLLEAQLGRLGRVGI